MKDPGSRMLLAQLGGNEDLGVIALCALSGLIAIGFFFAIYVGVYQTWRRKNEHKKAMGRVAIILAPKQGIPRDRPRKVSTDNQA